MSADPGRGGPDVGQLVLEEELQPGVERDAVRQRRPPARVHRGRLAGGAAPSGHADHAGPCTSASAQYRAQPSQRGALGGGPAPRGAARRPPGRCARGARAPFAGGSRHRSRSTTGSARSAPGRRGGRGDRGSPVAPGHLVDPEEQRAAPPAARRGVRAGGDRRDRRGCVQRAEAQRAAALGGDPGGERPDVGEVADAPARPRAAGRHLGDEAPGAEVGRQVAASGAGQDGGEACRPAPCSAWMPEGQVRGQVGRRSPASVPSSRTRCAGPRRSVCSPVRATTTPGPIGGASASRVGAHRGADRRRGCRARVVRQVPSVAHQPSSMPQASVATALLVLGCRGPCPGARRRSPRSAPTSTDEHVRLNSHAVAITGSSRSGFGATTTPVAGQGLQVGELAGRKVGPVLEQHVAPLSRMPDLDGSGQGLVHAPRTPSGVGWWGPEVGGSEVYSTSASPRTCMQELRVEGLPGDRARRRPSDRRPAAPRGLGTRATTARRRSGGAAPHGA